MNEDQVLDTGLFDINKAADPYSTANTGTFNPLIYSQGIRDFFDAASPLWNILRKESWPGMSYAYREQTSLPTPSFRSELETLPDATRADYGQKTFPLKSIYIRGEVSGQLQVAAQTMTDMVARAIRNASEGLIRGLELKLVTADSAGDPDEFDGIAKQITNTIDLDTDAGAGVTPGELTLEALDILLAAAPSGGVTHLLMSQAMHRKVNSLLQPHQRFVNSTTIDGGFTVDTFRGVPIIDVIDPHGGYFADKILAINNNRIVVPVATYPTYEELAHVRDSLDFMIKMYLAVVVEGPSRYHAKMINIDPTIT